MKKKLYKVLTVVLVVLMAGIYVLSSQSTVPDVQLVNGVPPLYSAFSPFPDGHYNAYRVYSAHVPFDQAVQSVLRDPRIKGWKPAEILFYRAAFASPDDQQHVFISRSETIELGPGQVVDPSSSDPHIKLETESFMHNAPDPHGWVTVTTDCAVNGLSGRIHRWGIALSNRVHPKGTRRFAGIAVLPKDMGTGAKPVDTLKGTSNLEGEAELGGIATMSN